LRRRLARALQQKQIALHGDELIEIKAAPPVRPMNEGWHS
jgi:hypothetical protein